MRTEARTPAHEGFKVHSKVTGFRGFLKLSVTVLGPNDVQQAHDLDAEYQKELAEETGYGGDGMVKPNLTMCTLCPRASFVCRIILFIFRKTTYLVVFVWEAEDLNIMESNLFSNTRIEAYVRVTFCGSQAITSVVCVRGRARLAPEFNEELWLPVTEPTETRRISVGLWNYSSHTRDRPIAHLYFDLDDIEHTSKCGTYESFLGGGLLEQNKYMGPRPRWYNLYGAPIRIQGKRGALQNRYGNEASTYRGRLLLSMELLARPPNEQRHKSMAHRRPFHFKPNTRLTSASAKYHLRALVVMGSEIPQFRSPAIGNSAKMRLVISIGADVIYVFDCIALCR